MHREHQPRRQKENPVIDSEGEYILDHQRHRTLTSEDSVKRQSRYQSLVDPINSEEAKKGDLTVTVHPNTGLRLKKTAVVIVDIT